MDRSQDRVGAIARGHSNGVHPESNVLFDGEMRKKRVILRDVRETTLLGRSVADEELAVRRGMMAFLLSDGACPQPTGGPGGPWTEDPGQARNGSATVFRKRLS